ncbi:MAG: aspartate-semialdehyde dehydrogenase [bacterium]
MQPNLAIFGATGLVGMKFLEILEQRNFPLGKLRLFASERSAGKKMTFRGQEYTVETITPGCFTDTHIALFSAGGGPSKQFAPQAAAEGAVVVDNSSAWRMDPTVPLVVPEVNADDLSHHKGIIANPNCSTIQMVVALYPIHKVNPIKKIFVATYQSVSGAGIDNVHEEWKQTAQWAKDVENLPNFGTKTQVAPELNPEIFKSSYPASTFSKQIAFNLIPHIGTFTENGYTDEELKLLYETRKIMHAPDVLVSPTTVRVPVIFGHSEAITIELTNPMTPEEARTILAQAPGIKVLDNPANKEYPTPLETAGDDFTYVGRIRQDLIFNPGLSMWVVSDNIRKGAATNAVQIAEELVGKGLLKK